MMKKIIFILPLAGLLMLGACHNQRQNQKQKTKSQTPSAISSSSSSSSNENNAPVMTFTETVHDFGKLVQGEIVKYDFHFKNTGKSDLRIERVSTSCGCTVGKYPHEPVKPGEEGDVVVTFNSSHKRGYQNKSVMLLANTKPARTVLRIKAVVEIPKDN